MNKKTNLCGRRKCHLFGVITMKKSLFVCLLFSLTVMLMACTKPEEEVVLTITEAKEKIFIDEEIQLSINKDVNPEEITWSTNNKMVASISEVGLVKGLAKGKVVITVKAGTEQATVVIEIIQEDVPPIQDEINRVPEEFEIWYEGFEYVTFLNEWGLNSDLKTDDLVGAFRSDTEAIAKPTELDYALRLTSNDYCDAKLERGFPAVSDGYFAVDVRLEDLNSQMSFEIYSNKSYRLFSIHLHQGGGIRYRIDKTSGGYGIRLESKATWTPKEWLRLVITWDASISESELRTYSAYILKNENNHEKLYQFARDVPFLYQTEGGGTPAWMKIRVNKGNDTDKMEGDYPANPTVYVDHIVLKSFQAMKDAQKVPPIDDSLVIVMETSVLFASIYGKRTIAIINYLREKQKQKI